jgi:hypothetical protein
VNIFSGVQAWLDKWHLIPGDPWQPDIEKALAESETCAVFVGPSGFAPWQNEEMRAAIDQRVRDSGRRFRVIPVLLPGANRVERSSLPTFLAATTWVEFHDSLNDPAAFYRLLSGIHGYPQIFISYRRDGSSAWAGRLYDSLSRHFVSNQIFMDVDTIELQRLDVGRRRPSGKVADPLVRYPPGAVIGERHRNAGPAGTPRQSDGREAIAIEVAGQHLDVGLRRPSGNECGPHVPVVVDHSFAEPNIDEVPGDNVERFTLNTPGLLSVKVGDGPTQAGFRVADPALLRQLLVKALVQSWGDQQ